MTQAKQQLIAILLITLLGFIGLAIPYPILAPMLLKSQAFSLHTHATRMLWYGALLAAYPIGQFLGSAILGDLSDHWGRRKILILSLLLTTIGYAISAIAVYQHYLGLFLFARLFTGLAEGNIAICRAAAADLSPKISKYTSFGLINAAGTCGFIIGPILAGVFSDKTIYLGFSYATPFFIALLLSLFTLIATYFFFTETFNPIKNKAHQAFSLFSLLITAMNNIIFTVRLQHIKWLLFSALLLMFSVDLTYQFAPLFLTAHWQMTSLAIAKTLFVLWVSIIIGEVWLVPLLAKRFNKYKLIFNSTIALSIFLILMITTTYLALLYAALFLLGIFIALSTTLATILISDAVNPHIQGRILGAFSSLRVLGDAIGAITGDLCAIFYPAAPLWLAVSMLIISLILLLVTKNKRKL
ncbi:Metal-tetracycline/H(+) antiporter [Piscirickettsia salmonis]|uniref:Sugar (And other) transporter family protein n=1 Tax=Piscirickettsia salmonis TaxID=1238 RepID=A0A1L6TGP0_PISSA|nr:MFS transporter [Piscirickettsia salmonis]ALB21540.1 sugar (and other) transporter family protein [Piscirickettsia salmonis]ALY01750.1 hypothetical protein AWE47_01770 [Piscirickettsia salmonis]AMA41265.1 hypothetical protein AWJ11_01775 [Piscirickettsia salmonis]AOS36461.1 hypothetical protein AVM72_14765 [Piscirickettsia salmonis]APS61144.1 hypothetical protein AVI53_11720 [Piscirickettsia salmonis]